MDELMMFRRAQSSSMTDEMMKIAKDSTWFERQGGINRAMRHPKAKGLGKLVADPELIGKRQLGGLKGAFTGGAAGIPLGALLGALAGGRGGREAAAVTGALMGGIAGVTGGQAVGQYKVDKKWLAKRGINLRALGLDAAFDDKAKKKYLK